jgi:hypothetical protein
MSNTNWNVNVVDGAVQVKDASGNTISPSASVNEYDTDTITLVPGTGVTITTVTISNASWTGGDGSYASPGPYTLKDGTANVLSIAWSSGSVVLTDLDSSDTASYNYKLGITVQSGGDSYTWDPTVYEKPPGG